MSRVSSLIEEGVVKRLSVGGMALGVCLLLVAGCGDDATEPEPPAPTFDLTFTGDTTFHGAHGGQTIHVGVFDQESGEMVADTVGTVSAETDPAFEFVFADVFTDGESYNLDYWIDSNFGGGEEGSCNSPDIDHQWRIGLSSVTADEIVNDTHRPSETESVC